MFGHLGLALSDLSSIAFAEGKVEGHMAGSPSHAVGLCLSCLHFFGLALAPRHASLSTVMLLLARPRKHIQTHRH